MAQQPLATSIPFEGAKNLLPENVTSKNTVISDLQ